MSLQFRHIEPHILLKNYIEKMWVFQSSGKMPVEDMKFNDKLGVSPKNLSSIIRFKQYYQALINDDVKSFSKNDFYELYYDQSHFIKNLKRFTGLPPSKFEKQINDFGENYYKE